MKIAVGSDHRGLTLKKELSRWLTRAGHEVLDCGCYERTATDYPDAAFAVGQAVGRGDFLRGLLICGSGIGMSIAANKVPGVRAALCHDSEAAEMTRRHNDSNVLCLGADQIAHTLARRIVTVWLETSFSAGRHARRLEKITRFEEKERGAGRSNSGAARQGPEGIQA